MKTLEDFPRYPIGHLPTPLEPMTRLGAELGCDSLLIKRDDATGLAMGGNKTRKLEFLVGEAIRQGADTLLSFGARQSNHARQTAAAAARAGMRCRLVLLDLVDYSEPAYEVSGNLLLERLLGAEIEIARGDADLAEVSQRIVEEERSKGHHVYTIPAGGSNAVGALGYVACARELIAQSEEQGLRIGTIITATSTAGTQAGLVAGLLALDADVRVVGVNVLTPHHSDQESALAKLTDAVTDKLEIRPAPPAALEIRHDSLGPGYGIPTDAMRKAVAIAARYEGVLLDPVYTGKAMASLISMIRSGQFDEVAGHKGRAVVFLHTGGTPGLFAYQEALTSW